MRCCGLAEAAWSRSPGLAEAAGRAEGRAACGRLRARAHVAASESGSRAGPSRRSAACVGKRAERPRAPEPMGRRSAESDALGLVQLKGCGVPGEVGRARVTCRCVTGLGESQMGRLGVSIPDEGGGVIAKRESVAGKGRSDQRQRGVEEIRADAGAAWRSKTGESLPRGRECTFLLLSLSEEEF